MKTLRKYIVKDQKVHIGLEVAKKVWKVSARSNNIEVDLRSVKGTFESLNTYLNESYHNCAINVVYEAGFSGYSLFDSLSSVGIECIVTPPNMVVQEKCNRVKTEKTDARRLAKNLEKNDVKSCDVPDKERREDRQISRTLVGIGKDIKRVRNRIRKFFDFHGLSAELPESAWSCAFKSRIRGMSLSEPLRIALDVMLDELEHLLNAKKLLCKKLKELTMKKKYARTFEIFKSAPGIGWLTAIRLVLEWGEDLSRFGSAESAACFSGFTQTEYSTGDRIRKGKIAKNSAPHVREWLIQCGWTSIKRDPVLLDKYERVMANTGSGKKAIVAVVRKLVGRLWACATKDTEYCIGLVE